MKCNDDDDDDDDDNDNAHAQVQATVRSHVARWRDGRHFQQATRISICVTAGQPGADAKFLEDAGNDDAVKPAVEHHSVDWYHREDRGQPGTHLPLLPMRTTVDLNSSEN